jgi:hypothetical protein
LSRPTAKLVRNELQASVKATVEVDNELKDVTLGELRANDESGGTSEATSEVEKEVKDQTIDEPKRSTYVVILIPRTRVMEGSGVKTLSSNMQHWLELTAPTRPLGEIYFPKGLVGLTSKLAISEVRSGW